MKTTDWLSIQAKWKEIEQDAKEGAEDFRVFCLTAKQTAEKLRNYYRFFVDDSIHPQNEITNIEALKKVYDQELQKVKQKFVDELQRSRQNLDSFDQFLKKSKNENERKTRLNYAKLRSWDKIKGSFLELLCLLSTLSSVRSSNSVRTVRNVFRSVGPIRIFEEGFYKNLWTQQTLSDTKSGLNARPDLIMTTPEQFVTTKNILSIVECKCVRQLSSTTIRAEFGKAHDLRINSYTIISYYNPDQKIVDGAKRLGIDVVPFRLRTKGRDVYLKNPAQLVEGLSEDLQKSREEKNFLRLLDSAADEARRKLPPPQ